MFIDLDGFKAVNDTLGHAAGDDLLRQVTTRFNACVRSADTLSRFGGDEFAVVLASVTDRTGGERVAEKLLRSLQEPFVVEGKEASVGASIGIVVPSNTVQRTKFNPSHWSFCRGRRKPSWNKLRHIFFNA